jgi:hypothetical protein
MHCPSSGVICYIDASISPDVYSPRLRQAGTGIKFVNLQVQPHNIIYIRALKDVSSVVMAEAAALAMAASIAIKFGFMLVSFLTDSSQLQQFLSAPDLNNPPDWRMLTYTQQYLSSTTQIQASLFKISRTDNLEADSLAKEAHLQAASVHQPSFLHCSFGAYTSQCQLFHALLSVNTSCTLILSAQCY